MKSILPKKILFSLGIFLFVFGVMSYPPQAKSAKLDFGAVCTGDSQCDSGECENSTKKDAKGQTIAYCVCEEEVVGEDGLDCAKKYGGTSSDWTCEDGGDASWNINYCVSTKDDNDKRYAVPVKILGALSGVSDAIIKSGTGVTKDEIDTLVTTPQPRIKIPGLNFTKVENLRDLATKEQTPDGREELYINIPFFGEYIATIYRFAVILASIWAIVYMMDAGLLLIIAGGNAEKIQQAKHKIVRGFSGLFIILGSYVLLYTLNPELVTFKNLRILYVETEPYPEITHETAHQGPGGTLLPANGLVAKKVTSFGELTEQDFTKDKMNAIMTDGWKVWQSFTQTEKQEVLPHLFKYIGECPQSSSLINMGINHANWSKKKIHKDALPAAQLLAKIADREGFRIYISSTYRTTLRQTQIWNTGIVARYKQKRSGWKRNEGKIGRPSCGSPHNSGAAMDVNLKIPVKKGGKITYKCVACQNDKKYFITAKTDSAAIKQYEQQYLGGSDGGLYRLILEEMFKEAGWVRYCDEYWHFETAVTTRYNKWDKAPETRCVRHYKNWKPEIEDNIKKKANSLTKTGTLFK